MTDPRRGLPGVDRLLASAPMAGLTDRFGRAPVVEAIREVLADARTRSRPEDGPVGVDDAGWTSAVLERLHARARPSLRAVVNATGVVLHTNLGRAPLAEAATEAMHDAAGYANLEYDLDAGRRGSRYTHCADLAVELTGAEDALVVNNCAAALLLALNTVAAGSSVVVSRGELVEIGGSFRVPEIMERSGARLVEVGSTNRTRPEDYREALANGAAALLKVHRSNFRVSGFTSEVGVGELAAIASEYGVPLIHDLGSGLLMDPATLGLPPEPTPASSIADGADLVCFSGDKLLGGPQAGFLVGTRAAVAAARHNPLCRALRVDKVTLAALAATLRLYRDPDTARRQIPVLRMLSVPGAELERRAHSFAQRIRDADIDAEPVALDGAVGGGTYPEVVVPSWGVRLPRVDDPGGLAARLRAGSPPVVVRVADGAPLLDLRTVAPDQEDALLSALTAAFRTGSEAE